MDEDEIGRDISSHALTTDCKILQIERDALQQLAKLAACPHSLYDKGYGTPDDLGVIFVTERDEGVRKILAYHSLLGDDFDLC